MKDRIFFLSLVLGLAGALVGCSKTTGKNGAELTWPAKESHGPAWARPKECIGIVEERFKNASTKALGTETDIAEIHQVINSSHPNWKLQVEELRWLSPSLAVARVRAPEAEYFYVIEKEKDKWAVLTYYLHWLS